MLSTTSVSGGKTSAYMALHYPTDSYIFACVRSNHPELAPTDKSLIAYCQSKLPGFIGTYEAPETLQALRHLEQMLGQEITWISADYSLEDYVFGVTDLPGYRSKKPRLYDKRTRFCTIQQKIMPIAQWCYMHGAGEPVLQNIGFRWDEPERVEKWKCENDKTRLPVACGLTSENKWKYEEIGWRISDFPLYRDRVKSRHIREFWWDKPINFPEISNCVMCPFHLDSELRAQSLRYPLHLRVAMEQEAIVGHTFGDRPLAERIEEPRINQLGLDFSCVCSD